MKTSFMLAISNLKQEIDNQELAHTFGSTVKTNQVNQIIDQKLASFPVGTSLNYKDIVLRVKRLVGDSTNDVFEREILVKIDALTEEIRVLKSKSSEVISFHQLGFRGPEEADSWVEEHCPSGRYGLVVDFHTMMEHIFQRIK